MKKIYLIRANKNPYGGAENYLMRLCNELKRRKIDYETINSNLPKFLPSWLRVLVFNYYLTISKGDKFYFSLERISCSDVYRAGDGVHKIHLKYLKKSKLNPLHPVYLYLEKKCFNNSKKIIVNSKMVKNEIKETYGIPDQKISVIYNGFDAEQIDYSESYKKIVNEFRIADQEYILLFVGSGFNRKGVESFLKIISQLNSKNFKAFVIGRDTNLRYYEKLSKEYLVEDKVIFTGPRKDVNDFYNISDFFIFPTKYEPFGNVVLEAMSYGNVVFTTKTNGASEILSPEFIMNSPEDESVAEKIDYLVTDQTLLSKIKLQNIQASKKFSVNRNVSETLRILDEVIN